MNLLSFGMVTLSWAIVGYLFYRIYRQIGTKPKLWKAVMVVFIGFFSFLIPLPYKGGIINLAVLPLGIFFLSLFLRRKKYPERWRAYRPYAWLGYLANYIFFISALIFPFIDNVVFPKDELPSYISSLEDSKIMNIHPSARKATFDDQLLKEQTQIAKQHDFFNQGWYEITYESPEEKGKKERFPYQLLGVEPKAGSGLHSVVFIEADGKGLLVSTEKGQVYFKMNDSILIWNEGEVGRD